MTVRAEADSAGVRGVLFDFHDTLVHIGDLAAWVARSGGEDVPADERTRVLAVLPDVWVRAAARWPGLSWDLGPSEHRRAFTQVLQEDADARPGWRRSSTTRYRTSGSSPRGSPRCSRGCATTRSG